MRSERRAWSTVSGLVSRLPSSVTWVTALGIVLLAGYSVAKAGAAGRSIDERTEDVLKRERFTVGRLSERTDWQPCAVIDTSGVIVRSHCGSASAEPQREAERLEAIARELRMARQSDSSIAMLRASAVLDLRFRDVAPSALDRAIATLSTASERAPSNPAVFNALAVALLEKGEREQDMRSALAALDAVEHAASLDSGSTSILFNRALALERLYLLASAHDAWTTYLAVERDAQWRNEAQGHLRALAERSDDFPWRPMDANAAPRLLLDEGVRLLPHIRRSPQRAREFSFGALGAWGSAFAAGDSANAGSILAMAGRVADTLDAVRADASIRLALRTIRERAGDREATAMLASAHRELAAGFALYARSSYEEAERNLSRAEHTLRAIGSPMARWAASYRGACELGRGLDARADTTFARVIAEGTIEEPALVGKATWALGVSQGHRGNYELSNGYHRRAAAFIARAKEPENEGAISFLLAENLNFSGQLPAARAEAFRGLQLLSPHRRSSFLRLHLTTVASVASSEDLRFAAAAVTDELLHLARRADNPNALAIALLARARIRAALGQQPGARRDLAEAVALSSRLEGARQDRVRADALLIEAQVSRATSPGPALAMLERVLGEYRRLHVDLFVPEVLHEIARASRDAGDAGAGRAYIGEAIGLIEQQRVTFGSAESRAALDEETEKVFDTAIEMELAAGDSARAFEYLERERSGAWFDAPALREVGAHLPAALLLVEYALLPGQLVIWTASATETHTYTVPIGRDSVAALVERFARESGSTETSDGAARARLYDILLRPIAAELGPIRHLAVVPDRELARVPFAALWDRVAHQYVVERLQVRTQQSAAFFIAARTLAASKPSVPPRAFLIGNPQLDTTAEKGLAPLPGAAREAELIRSLYTKPTMRTGNSASRAQVVSLLATHSVVHFAGHAVFNSEQPELSYLALAPDGAGSSGRLAAREIGAMRLSNLRLVVLSACSSLSARPTRTGALAGLAFSFLRAGAPAAVSTLWDVDDATTTQLLVTFHRFYAAGVAAPEALRLAQLESLRSGRRGLAAPAAWAGFIYSGS